MDGRDIAACTLASIFLLSSTYLSKCFYRDCTKKIRNIMHDSGNDGLKAFEDKIYLSLPPLVDELYRLVRYRELNIG